MKVSTTRVNGVTVVQVPGELTAENREAFREAVLDRLRAGERRFVFDFQGAGYIDSSGLGVLVSLARRIREGGGELRLAALNEDLLTLFQLTRLDTVFQISESRATALREL